MSQGNKNEANGFFFLVSGLLLWTGFLIFLIIYVMENEGIRNE
jgi:hypothetical protein